MNRSTFDRPRRFAAALAQGARLGSARFPVAVACICAIAALANLGIADIELFPDDDLPRVLSMLYGAMAASIVTTLFLESRKCGTLTKMLSSLTAASLVALHLWFAPLLVGSAPLVVALTFAVPLAPFVRRGSDAAFWSFTLWSCVGIVLAFFSVLLFALGVSAILEMIRFLFGIGLGSQAYEHIYATATTLVGPLLALGRIPRGIDDTLSLAAADRLAAGIRIVIDWVAVPLTLATTIVLHLYAAKILSLQTLPKNEIGWIVTFFSCLVLSLRIGIDPFVGGGSKPTRLFARLWAPALVVPLVLLVIAAGLRIDAEGFTVERYYLALGAFVSVACVVLQVAPKPWRNIRLLAGLPVLALALSSAGPQGVTETVARSQIARIRADLGEAISAAGSIRLAGLDDGTKTVLRSRIAAIVDVDGQSRLLPLLPEPERSKVADIAEGDDPRSQIIAILGLSQPMFHSANTEFRALKPVLLDVAGYDLMARDIDVESSGDSAPDMVAAAFQPLGEGTAAGLTVFFRGRAIRFPLADAFGEKATAGMDANPPDVSPLVVDLQDKAGRKIRLVVTQLVLSAATRQPVSATVTILLRSADWPASSPGSPSLGGG